MAVDFLHRRRCRPNELPIDIDRAAAHAAGKAIRRISHRSGKPGYDPGSLALGFANRAKDLHIHSLEFPGCIDYRIGDSPHPRTDI